jgi:hypothetical protein
MVWKLKDFISEKFVGSNLHGAEYEGKRYFIYLVLKILADED